MTYKWTFSFFTYEIDKFIDVMHKADTLHLWLENPTPTKSHGLWWASLLFLYIIHHVRRTDLCE